MTRVYCTTEDAHRPANSAQTAPTLKPRFFNQQKLQTGADPREIFVDLLQLVALLPAQKGASRKR